MWSVEEVVQKILATRDQIPRQRSVLVALSGIDASGKGYIAARIVAGLRTRGVGVANINVDGWLNLPHKRFNPANPGEHFYLNAIRFDDLFSQLVLPLRDRRSLRIETDFAEERAPEYRRHLYEFEDVDVIVLEGIYLLRRATQAYYDLSFWIDCSFETALERAKARSQEGLGPKETAAAYRTIYFPAQDLHFRRDDPRGVATAVVNNDPRLGT